MIVGVGTIMCACLLDPYIYIFCANLSGTLPLIVAYNDIAPIGVYIWLQYI